MLKQSQYFGFDANENAKNKSSFKFFPQLFQGATSNTLSFVFIQSTFYAHVNYALPSVYLKVPHKPPGAISFLA